MKGLFKPGDSKEYRRIVRREDTAAFDSGEVHPVYATFALARDAEWACRLFVLEMKDEDEEGIGTMLQVNHMSPALLGSEVVFEARVKSLERNLLICIWQARAEGRLIAEGETGQKILKKDKLEMLFNALEKPA